MTRRGENIYKRKDGRWEGRYAKGRKTNGTIHYGYVYGYKYKEVKQRLIHLKSTQQHADEPFIKKYEGTLNEWSADWLKEIKPDVKPSTYSSYSTKLTHHILPVLGNQPIYMIKKNQVEYWLNSLRDELAISSIHATYRVLRSCLNYAVKRSLIIKNPCTDVQLPKQKSSTVQSLTKQEQERLEKVAKQHKAGLPILIALETGMRIGEIAGLKWQDIDFLEQVIRVKRTLQRVATEGARQKTELVELSPKSSNSVRIIPLSQNMSCLLQKMQKEAQSDYVVGKRKALEPRVINYHFKQICQKAQLPPVHFHALRHTFATRCLENGATVATISDLLGHSSIKMTLDTYISSFLTEKRKAIDSVSSL
ncbi:tyrosine-type recombinase/integrase [Enterococcus crotali]|uniref:tyrosine-type recombinase/integrase n=1 Tax=Enterococcus crotali TaxID=1453587 RepID=UPI00046FE8D6|nr:site-specific integrase [Enterococcus crotali]